MTNEEEYHLPLMNRHFSKPSEYIKLRVMTSYGFEVKLSQSLKEPEYVNFLHHFWFPSWLC